MQRSILRLGILLLLFDVYLTWARIEKLPLSPTLPYHPSSLTHVHNTSSPTPLVPPYDGITNAAILQAQPLIGQYFFFLLLVTLCTLVFHVPIRLLCAVDPTRLPAAVARVWKRFIPHFERSTPLSTALLVSSCTKLFPILLIIWDYDLPSSATAVSWAVIVNNVAALEILMDCGYVRAGFLVGVGAGLRMGVGWGVLRLAGLGTGWEGYGDVGVWESIEQWGREMVGVW